MYEIITIDTSLIEPTRAIIEYLIPAAVTYFSGKANRKAAKSQAEKDREFQREQAELLEKQKQEYRDMVFTNPYADMTSAYAGLQTDFKNLAQDARNVYADATNPYAELQNQFAGMENLYEGMENRFEDLTVDTRAADFQAEQGRQQRANILQGLRRSAGASGIAPLAQALANQGQLQSQQIAAGISQQERQNQMLAAREGARIDQLQRGAGMQLQQIERAGAQQLQAQQAAGAMAQQQMQMRGASEQQRLQLAGAQQARSLGIARENLLAQGEQQTDLQRRLGEQMLQEAEMSRQATLLGMQYGESSGANQQLQMSLYNQQQANNAADQMFINALGSIPFGDIFSGGSGSGSGLTGGFGANQPFPEYYGTGSLLYK